MLDIGFTEVRISKPFDSFGSAKGEKNARVFEVDGDFFLAKKPV